MRNRLHRGAINKARRGELFNTVPVGYSSYRTTKWFWIRMNKPVRSCNRSSTSSMKSADLSRRSVGSHASTSRCRCGFAVARGKVNWNGVVRQWPEYERINQSDLCGCLCIWTDLTTIASHFTVLHKAKANEAQTNERVESVDQRPRPGLHHMGPFCAKPRTDPAKSPGKRRNRAWPERAAHYSPECWYAAHCNWKMNIEVCHGDVRTLRLRKPSPARHGEDLRGLTSKQIDDSSRASSQGTGARGTRVEPEGARGSGTGAWSTRQALATASEASAVRDRSRRAALPCCGSRQPLSGRDLGKAMGTDIAWQTRFKTNTIDFTTKFPRRSTAEERTRLRRCLRYSRALACGEHHQRRSQRDHSLSDRSRRRAVQATANMWTRRSTGTEDTPANTSSFAL